MVDTSCVQIFTLCYKLQQLDEALSIYSVLSTVHEVFFSGHQEPLCHPITVEEGWDKYNKDQPSCPTCTIAKQ